MRGKKDAHLSMILHDKADSISQGRFCMTKQNPE